eukprot:1411814-Rhodomonas_salina.2
MHVSKTVKNLKKLPRSIVQSGRLPGPSSVGRSSILTLEFLIERPQCVTRVFETRTPDVGTAVGRASVGVIDGGGAVKGGVAAVQLVERALALRNTTSDLGTVG